MRIALISLNQSWEDKKKNLIKCENYILKAKIKNANLIIFPELTLTGFSFNIDSISEHYDSSETIRFFKKLAINNKINIIFGVCIQTKEGANNKSILVNSLGKVVIDYSKIHLFSFANEDKYFIPGKKISFGNFNKKTSIGITICYDLRFPELYHLLSKNCEVIINIANWPLERIDHWRTLLKARAIENQLFIVGVNRTGIDFNKLSYPSSSMIFGPTGNKCKPVYKTKIIGIYDIDINEVAMSRKLFPNIHDRRNFLEI